MASLINIECKRYGCIKNLLACYANCRYSGRCDDLKNEILDKTDQAAKDINSYLSDRGRKPITIQIMKRGVRFTDTTNVKNVIPSKVEHTKSAHIATRIKSEIKPSPRPVIGASAKIEARKEPIKLKRKKSRRRVKPKSFPSFSAAESNVVNIRKSRAASYLEKTQALPTRKRKPARKSKKSAKTKNKIIAKAARNSFELNQRESITMPKRSITKSIESPVEAVSNITSADRAASANGKAKMPRAARRKGSSKSRSASRNGKVYIILEGKTASIVDEQGLMQHLFASPSNGARYFEASEVEARVHIVIKK